MRSAAARVVWAVADEVRDVKAMSAFLQLQFRELVALEHGVVHNVRLHNDEQTRVAQRRLTATTPAMAAIVCPKT